MGALTEINETLKNQTKIQTRIDKNLDAFLKEQRRSRLKAVEAQVEATSRSVSSRGGSATGSAGRGGFLGGLTGGALGRGLLGAAGGGLAMAGALGLALPAFFGGLMAGEAGLDWLSSLGANFDFDSLTAAAVGFSDIITSMDPQSFVVLAGIMAVSAVGGRRAALGLGTMGLAITSFLGGLLAGEGTFDVLSMLGANFNFDSLKEVMTGFSDAILGLSPEAALALVAIMGAGGVSGLAGRNPLNVSAGMAAIAAGIIGFFGGLLGAEGALDLALQAGAGLNFDSLSTVFAGFSTAVGSLSNEAITALGAILGVATTMSVFTRYNTVRAALGVAAVMSGIGAGIAGFMFGLSAGAAGIEWLQNISGATGAGLVSAFEMFNASVGALDETALTAFGVILTAGTGIGALTGAAGGVTALFAAGGIGLVMAGIGAGIAGLMIGLTAADVGISWLQRLRSEGTEGLPGVFRMFNDSILNITPAAIERIQDLMRLGGLDIAGALGGLSAGVAAFFASEGLVSLGQSISEGVLGTIDAVFGTDLNRERPGAIQQMISALEPIQDFDLNPINEFSDAISGLSRAFGSLADLRTTNISSSVMSLMRDIGGVLGIMPFLLRGGYYRGERLGYGDNIDFGPEGSGGLLGLRDEDLEALREGVGRLYRALDISSPITGAGGDANLDGGAGQDRLISAPRQQDNYLRDLFVETLTAQQMSTGAPVVINNVDNSSRNSSNATIRYDANLSPHNSDYFLRRNLAPGALGY